ncbi:hypothetical protein BH10ACI1_BH10ACI1_28570 [soil metagenome]
MDHETHLYETRNFLIKHIAEEFVRAIYLIENVSDEIYVNIGGHFRHNVDFANNFLNGLTAEKIDYSKRERDERIEQNRQYAIEKIVLLIRHLQSLPDEVLEKEISVCSEIDETVWHISSVMRELEFLHSHTVHHHALIAEKLAVFGVKVSKDFGVAPSTLKFWAKVQSAN